MKDKESLKESLNAVSGPVWWPELSRENQDLVQPCRVCTLQRDNNHEPLITTPLLDHRWQIIATDLFKLKGLDYLIVIDYLSRHVEVAEDYKVK